MSLLDNVKRIIVEEFKQEDRDMASRLAQNWNFFAEQVVNTVNGNLDYDNLNRDLKEIDVTVNTSGIPNQTTKFSAKIGAIDTLIINARNLTNSATYPESSPFISFTPNGQGLYTINKINGLQANNKYRLTFEVIY